MIKYCIRTNERNYQYLRFLSSAKRKESISQRIKTLTEYSEEYMEKIIRNAVQCKVCGDVIESKSRHDFVRCKCGACAVDGGHEYLRRLAKSRDCIIEMSIVEEEEEEEEEN